MKSRKTVRILLIGGVLLLGWVLISWPGRSLATTLKSINLPLVLNQWPAPLAPDGKLLITEVLCSALEEPAGEGVEIYNPGRAPVDLSDYKVGDEETFGEAEGMVQFPAGATIAAGQIIVVAHDAAVFRALYGKSPDFEMTAADPLVPDMIKYAAWATRTVELVNTGDEVLLLDTSDEVADAVSWGSSSWAFDPAAPTVDKGQSIERSPAYHDSDSAADWVEQVTPTPGSVDLSTPTPQPTALPTLATPSGPARLLISEVLYDPNGDDPALEWIELYNAGSDALGLWNYKLGDEETPGGGEGMYQFPEGAIILPGEIIVIANQAAAYEQAYGAKPDYELSVTDPGVPSLIKYSDWAGGSANLADSGDEVILLDDSDTWLDAVSWGSSKIAFDPSVPLVAQASSVERYPASADTDTAADWREQFIPSPGLLDLTLPTVTPTPTTTPTPTATPVPTPLPPLVINEIHADPAEDLLGDANGDGIRDASEDEFLEIVNTTDSALDVIGYKIQDALGERFVFTQTAVIPAGCGVIVFGGGNPQGDFGGMLVQVDDSGGLSLNNDGDTITLLDGEDQVIATYTYGSEGGDNQSLTRDPDITGSFVKHSAATDSDGASFSPGTRVNGAPFAGCSVSLTKQLHREDG